MRTVDQKDFYKSVFVCISFLVLSHTHTLRLWWANLKIKIERRDCKNVYFSVFYAARIIHLICSWCRREDPFATSKQITFIFVL